MLWCGSLLENNRGLWSSDQAVLVYCYADNTYWQQIIVVFGLFIGFPENKKNIEYHQSNPSSLKDTHNMFRWENTVYKHTVAVFVYKKIPSGVFNHKGKGECRGAFSFSIIASTMSLSLSLSTINSVAQSGWSSFLWWLSRGIETMTLYIQMSTCCIADQAPEYEWQTPRLNRKGQETTTWDLECRPTSTDPLSVDHSCHWSFKWISQASS